MFEINKTINTIQALEKVKNYCHFQKKYNLGCNKCMLYDENKKSCLVVQQKKIPEEWELLIKVEL